MAGTLRYRVRVEGLEEIKRALARLPDNAKRALKLRSEDLALLLAIRMRAAASGQGRQAARAATSVKVVKNATYPTITAGGVSKSRSGAQRPTPGSLLYGSEFGATRHFGWYGFRRYDDSSGRQFAGRTAGNEGHWFFPTVRRESAAITAAFTRAADDVIREWSA